MSAIDSRAINRSKKQQTVLCVFQRRNMASWRMSFVVFRLTTGKNKYTHIIGTMESKTLA